MQPSKNLSKIKCHIGFGIDDLNHVYGDGKFTTFVLKNGKKLSFDKKEFSERILEILTMDEAMRFLSELIDRVPHI